MSLEKTFPIYKKIHASGNIGFRVDMGYIGGKRTFKSFPTEEAARNYQKRCLEIEARKKPVDLRDLNESSRHEVLSALAKLRDHNATITQAVDFFIKHANPARGDASISEIMAKFRSAKSKAGMSPKYLDNSDSSFFTPFKRHFSDCPVSELTTEDCQTYLDQHTTWNATTKRSHIRHLSVLCNFAVEKGYMSYNPFTKVEKPKRPPSTSRHRVATVENVIKILNFALNNGYKQECTALVLILFCGVRTEEVSRLKWEDIKLDESPPAVHLFDDITKATKTRINEIPANALQWLKRLREKGPVVGAKFEGRMRYLRKMSDASFKQNAARVSFASYHIAMHENGIKTAFLLGHDNPTLLYNTYKAVVTKSEAERYWKITPDYNGWDRDTAPTENQLRESRIKGFKRALQSI